MDSETVTKVLGFAGLVVVVLGAIGGMLPWKSRRLSPASTQRRLYWTGCVVGAVLVFVSQLPNPGSGLIIAFAVVFVMVGTAWRFTSHLKIGGKIYAASAYHRRPDPPPGRGGE